ncbi:MAG: PKD domain-containing protein, partial [Proteobacteria bacterium]|nr:PKD domain-containing protein [Pseudomonadota bacterium]
TGALTPTHIYADNGPLANGGAYTATLTIADDNGGMNSDVLLITVRNVAPTVEAGPDQIIDESATVHFGGSFTDPGSADTHTIEWNFGDGATAGGALSMTHTYVESGTYTVTITVTDDDDSMGSDTLLVSINEVAVAPSLYYMPLVCTSIPSSSGDRRPNYTHTSR